jgi:phosphocarrier protein HPr
MIRRVVKVENKLGLHARAAARLVRTASRFRSAIHLAREGSPEQIDSKSILGVLMLAAAEGTRLVISCDGDDEDEACRAVCALFANRFGEEN